MLGNVLHDILHSLVSSCTHVISNCTVTITFSNNVSFPITFAWEVIIVAMNAKRSPISEPLEESRRPYIIGFL